MFTRLFFLNSYGSTRKIVNPISLPLDVPIEEELILNYNYKHFYHPKPGEILNGKYELKAKLDFGTTSTV
jgi:serine/threonine-protein kinase SRPK3